jgi:general secretion pathway protein F
MTAFRWVAIDAAGQIQRGVTEAASAAEVIGQIQRRGQIPMRAEPAGPGGLLRDALSFRLGRRDILSARDVAAVTRELSVMLGAGMDLDRALRFLVETKPNARVGAVLTRVRDKVRGGSPLAAALALEPDSFSRLYIGLVRAGEAGGTLAETLDRLAGLLDKDRKLAASVGSALIYPAMLMLAAVGSIVLLLTYVLPQFKPLFAQSGVALPTSTRILMAVGDDVGALLPWLLPLLAIALLAALQALKLPAVRRMRDRALLRVPILGELIRETLAARFARTLGTLLRNGVPLITALGIVRETLGNRVAEDVIDETIESARGGAGLARPLARAGLFPARTVHLLQLGEETAQLAELALRAAEIDEDHVQLTVQRLMALLVPGITITMGAAVASIIVSLMMAMLSLNDIAG